MTWEVTGTEVYITHSSNGSIGVYGHGTHECRGSDLAFRMMKQAGDFRAQWELHECAEAASRTAEILNTQHMLRDMAGTKYSKDEPNEWIETMRSGSKTLAMITHADDYLIFCFYLPRKQFDAVLGMFQNIVCGAKVRHSFNVDSIGLNFPFDHWVAGREILTEGVSLSFLPES